MQSAARLHRIWGANMRVLLGRGGARGLALIIIANNVQQRDERAKQFQRTRRQSRPRVFALVRVCVSPIRARLCLPQASNETRPVGALRFLRPRRARVALSARGPARPPACSRITLDWLEFCASDWTTSGRKMSECEKRAETGANSMAPSASSSDSVGQLEQALLAAG